LKYTERRQTSLLCARNLATPTNNLQKPAETVTNSSVTGVTQKLPVMWMEVNY